MRLVLSEELKRYIAKKVKSGAFDRPEDVVRAGLFALKQQEEFGDFAPGELDALLAEGERSLKSERAYTGEEVFAELRARSVRRRASGTRRRKGA